MREILFRGRTAIVSKGKYNGEWLYGNLIQTDSGNFYIGSREVSPLFQLVFQLVIPETVGQYTGLKDKNGVKIFDGDIVKITDDFGDTDCIDGGIGEVCFAYGLWYVCGDVNNGLYDSDRTCWIEVIGNIYDSRELLEVLK